MKYISLTLLLTITTLSLNAQIFDRIINRTQDKISREISDRIVERISDEITRAAMKPVDDAIDDMLRERYVQDSINGKTSSGNYDDFVAAFLTPVDLPENYTFDMTLESEMKDYDGDKSRMDMMLTENGSAIGIIQYTEEGESTMVFDMKNNIMAIYTDGKEGKKVMAMPSIISMAGAMAAAETDEDAYEITVKKTGKTKKILGYETEEWEIDDEATKTKAYVANDFPIAWKNSFGQFLQEMMPTTQRDQMPEGMALKSETKTKKKNKKSSYIVKKIIDTPTKINNSEYEQTSYTSED